MTTIKVSEGSAVRLCSLNVWTGKVARAKIVNVPNDAEAVAIELSGACTSGETVAAKPTPGGDWHVGLPASCFTSPGRGAYHIVATLAEGSICLGGGSVFVS